MEVADDVVKRVETPRLESRCGLTAPLSVPQRHPHLQPESQEHGIEKVPNTFMKR